MPFTLTIRADEGYVLVEHEGKVTADEVREARNAMLAALAEQKIERLLVDWRRATAFPQTADFYFVVNETKRVSANARCAIVHSQDSGGLAQFVENAARNRGLRVHAFPSPEQALAWLFC